MLFFSNHREFLHFLQMPVQASAGHFHSEELEFDPEWCAVLTHTHHLLQTRRGDVHLPQQVEKMGHQVRFTRVCVVVVVVELGEVGGGACDCFPRHISSQSLCASFVNRTSPLRVSAS